MDTASYMALETVKRDGRRIATPVWFARAEDAYYVFSAPNAGKVKRLRHSASVRIAECSMRGKVIGEWYATTAILVADRHTIRTAHAALRKKYGWQMMIADFFAGLAGRLAKRQYIRIQRPV